jgi:heterodisulfide reductase subunit A-like polyferredoxin
MEKIGRRNLLRYSVTGLALAASAKALPDGLVPVEQQQADGAVENNVDVLVVGGGTAGTIAAIQTARAGAAAALAVEKQTSPGEVPLDELKALLKIHDAILAGEAREVSGSHGA